MQNQSSVIMYTDGGCRGNPGPGGWGVVIYRDGEELHIKGSQTPTTNNRMELLAAIEGLSALADASKVDLYTDSQYVCKGMSEWIKGWKAKNWRTANKQPVKNADLWQQLDELARRHTVQWKWVKGHSGDPGNELADRLANEAMDELEAALRIAG